MRPFLLSIIGIFMVATLWISLNLGQIEGPPANPESVVRNILYAHVPSSMCALLCFAVLFVASIGYLITAKQSWDMLAAAAGEVGMVLATVSNLTGMIFSRAEWNTWWTPSPRLIFTSGLWFLYAVYLIIRASIPDSQRRKAKVSAIFGIIAFIDVPLVWFSARLIPDIHREKFIGDTWQIASFWSSVLAVLLFSAVLIWIRTDILKNKAKLERESML